MDAEMSLARTQSSTRLTPNLTSAQAGRNRNIRRPGRAIEGFVLAEPFISGKVAPRTSLLEFVLVVALAGSSEFVATLWHLFPTG